MGLGKDRDNVISGEKKDRIPATSEARQEPGTTSFPGENKDRIPATSEVRQGQGLRHFRGKTKIGSLTHLS